MDNTNIELCKIGRNNAKLSLDDIICSTDRCIVVKGAKITNKATSVVYILDKEINHRYFRNQTLKAKFVTADNKNIHFDFVVWEYLKVKNGSIISGHTNMTSDSSKHTSYCIKGVS